MRRVTAKNRVGFRKEPGVNAPDAGRYRALHGSELGDSFLIHIT